jgi:hypothetical protein
MKAIINENQLSNVVFKYLSKKYSKTYQYITNTHVIRFYSFYDDELIFIYNNSPKINGCTLMFSYEVVDDITNFFSLEWESSEQLLLNWVNNTFNFDCTRSTTY